MGHHTPAKSKRDAKPHPSNLMIHINQNSLKSAFKIIVYKMASLSKKRNKGITKAKGGGRTFCSAVNCSNSKHSHPQLSFFCFPRDDNRYALANLHM